MSGILMPIGAKVSPYYIERAGNNGGGGNFSITVPNSSQLASDLLVNICGASGVCTWADTSSYTEILDQGALPSIRVATKIDGGAETTCSVQPTGGPPQDAGYILRFRSARSDVVGTVATTTANGTLALPSVTSVGGLLLAVVVCSTTAPTCTTPAGFTAIFNETTQFLRMAVFYKAVNPGATGAVNTTIATISGTAAGVLVGLK